MLIKKEEDIEIVSKEEAEKRINTKHDLWEGFVQEMPSKDRKYIVVTKFNKYRQSDFTEQFKYKF
jgi:hypothetical protein